MSARYAAANIEKAQVAHLAGRTSQPLSNLAADGEYDFGMLFGIDAKIGVAYFCDFASAASAAPRASVVDFFD